MMKKAIILILAIIFSLSSYSCRETTQEKTEEAAEAIGEDIEAGAKKAGEKIKEGAKKAGEDIKKGAEKIEKEVEEEVNNTDDVNNAEAADDF